MINCKKIYYLTLLLSLINGVKGQDLGIMYHWNFDASIYNPASSGKFLPMSAFFMNRTQWTKIEGNPQTQIAGINMGFDKNNHGIGFMVFNQKMGPLRQTGSKFNYAFHIPLEEMYLSLGVSGHFYQFHVENNDINLIHTEDPVFEDLENKLTGDATFGMYLYTKTLEIGLSIPNLVAQKIKWTNDSQYGIFNNQRQYILSASYPFEVQDMVVVKPELITAYTEGANIQAQLGAKAILKDMFYLGTFFSTNQSGGFLFGGNYKNQYKLTYAFEIPLNSSRHYFSTSHNIFLHIGLFNGRKYNVKITNKDLRY
tara:strand:+ start:6855 stop:7790 length:936 start_codon:yes stop_codon:yes gene_type:complete